LEVAIVEEAKREVKSLSYFASDGSYGDAVGLTVIDTTDWMPGDFDLLEGVTAEDLPDAARVVSEWLESGRDSETFAPLFDRYNLC
jgi:hypothetical protein